MMTVQVRFYTDPACPWSWAAEPALRRLMWEFEGELEILAEKPLPVLEAELWEMARDWKLKPVRALTGALWQPA